MAQLEPKTLLRVEEALSFYLGELQKRAVVAAEQDAAQIRDDIDELSRLLKKVTADYDEQSKT